MSKPGNLTISESHVNQCYVTPTHESYATPGAGTAND